MRKTKLKNQPPPIKAQKIAAPTASTTVVPDLLNMDSDPTPPA